MTQDKNQTFCFLLVGLCDPIDSVRVKEDELPAAVRRKLSDRYSVLPLKS